MLPVQASGRLDGVIPSIGHARKWKRTFNMSDRVFQVCHFYYSGFARVERLPESLDELRDMDRWKAFAALMTALIGKSITWCVRNEA